MLIEVKKTETTTEKITGTVSDIVYKNEDNGYAVVEIESAKMNFVAVGIMYGINEGENVILSGHWTEHPSYGEQFKVEICEKMLPTTREEILKYLSAGIIKGIRKATAEKIIEKFGEKSLEIIEKSPELLGSIRGISPKKAAEIGESFKGQLGTSDLFMFLQRYGISANVCMKIYRKHKIFKRETIIENPYILCDEAYSVSFKKADMIATDNGFEKNSEKRIYAGIVYVLKFYQQFGHTYLPLNILADETSVMLGIHLENFEKYVDYLCDTFVCFSETKDNKRAIYLYEYHDYECSVARRLAELSETIFDITDINIEKRIEISEQKSTIRFAELQKEAVRTALENSVMVITGGPGTGKTTIINAIIDIMQSVRLKVVLTAPTGRAAKRMTQVCNMEAKTIHRLLEANYVEGDEIQCTHDASDPLDADVVIVDEMSMVDIVLMNSLLNAIRPGARLIMVGDINQLPSVGAGDVLRNIIASEKISVIRLNEIFRQSEKSMIASNAHEINMGRLPECNTKGSDFYFAELNNNSMGENYICELCHTRLKNAYGYDPFDIQVLSPTKKGITGVNNLNNSLQKLLNPPSAKKAEKVYGDIVFRHGDKVMQIKNNYTIGWNDVNTDIAGEGVFNGDVGYIEEINNEFHQIKVIYDEKRVTYDFKDLSELTLAYCITVHKSQGSEFPVVIMPMFSAPGMLLSRNLLYTGVTRAKKLVVLVGEKSIMKKMIDNDREDKRFSGLTEKIKNEFENKKL